MLTIEKLSFCCFSSSFHLKSAKLEVTEMLTNNKNWEIYIEVHVMNRLAVSYFLGSPVSRIADSG
jgi:hypothetical protein